MVTCIDAVFSTAAFSAAAFSLTAFSVADFSLAAFSAAALESNGYSVSEQPFMCYQITFIMLASSIYGVTRNVYSVQSDGCGITQYLVSCKLTGSSVISSE
jgi:hypothetical protein